MNRSHDRFLSYALGSLWAVSGCGLDFDRKSLARDGAAVEPGERDAGDDGPELARDSAAAPDADEDVDDSGDAAANADAGADAAGATDDAGASDDAESDVDECAGDHGCPAEYPCQNRAGGYVCLGQFADYPIPQRRYADDAAARGYVADPAQESVLDTITGLMWMARRAPNGMSWPAAAQFCENSTLGGHDDWRLPSINDFATLFATEQYRGFPTNVFPDQGEGWTIWLSGKAPGGAGPLRWEEFEGRPTSDPSKEAGGIGYVRCVRTAEVHFAGPPQARYGSADQGRLVEDRATGLTWMHAPLPGTSLKGDAAARCQGSSPGGRPFRLPTWTELLSILDTTRIQPVLSSAFLGEGECEWSSTLGRDPAIHRIFVEFRDYILVTESDQSYHVCRVRCVSDPP